MRYASELHSHTPVSFEMGRRSAEVETPLACVLRCPGFLGLGSSPLANKADGRKLPPDASAKAFPELG